MEADEGYKKTNYKLRVYAQGIVYQKKKIPTFRNETDPTTGATVVTGNEYEEYECPQLAINFNGLYIEEKRLRFLLSNLSEQIIKQFKDKGIVR